MSLLLIRVGWFVLGFGFGFLVGGFVWYEDVDKKSS